MLLGMLTYRLDQTYDWHYEHGPVWDAPMPALPVTTLTDFLGFPIRAPRFGVAAGLLLNSRWVSHYAKLGFDIVTYKTVRSAPRACYPLPNWVVLEAADDLDPDDSDAVMTAATDPQARLAAGGATSSVSFGMPSQAPAIWRADIAAARAALGTNQVLIVSVVATPGAADAGKSADHGNDPTADLVADFAWLAEHAASAGAHVVEANLSCPNVCSAEGSVYLDAALSGRVAAAMRQAVGPDTPLLLKVGHFRRDQSDAMHRLLDAVAPHVQGVILVNGVSRRVVDHTGAPAFGPGRERAGILGAGIHQACLENVSRAMERIERRALNLKVLAVGGVDSLPAIRRCESAGAYAVLAGGAPMFDPLLAVRVKQELAG